MKKITTDALRILGFITRNALEFNSVESVKTLYVALARSKLEYCSIVWTATYQCYIAEIERVQRRFVKVLYLYFVEFGYYPARRLWDYGAYLERYGMMSLLVCLSVAIARTLVSGNVVAPVLLKRLYS